MFNIVNIFERFYSHRILRNNITKDLFNITKDITFVLKSMRTFFSKKGLIKILK